ncbi:MAG: PHP domain-containing protein, partial [Pseudomonadales bacterium]|nr:PHP domain-containing protein [Pseudomonadales bacterium]
MKVPQKTCYDLHTHSKLSDGSLSPASLIALAEKQGVTHLSITDHDTLNAYAQLASDTFQLTLIPGIELSTQWQGRCIHIVGLNVDPASTSMQTAVESQKNAREKRAELIAHRLKKAGIDAAL